ARPKAQEAKLERETMAVGLEEPVDPGGVALQRAALDRVERTRLRRSDPRQSEAAQEAIEQQRRLAEDLREASQSDPPIQLHLPEAVLGMNVTEGIIDVVAGRGVDVRDAGPIANDLHVGPDPRWRDEAVERRPWLAQRQPVQPRAGDRRQAQAGQNAIPKTHLSIDPAVRKT